MSEDHERALEAAHAQIMEHFGKDAPPREREKIEGLADLGMLVAGFLQSEIADAETWVDTGSDGQSYDCHVKVNGREYTVNISPGYTDEEMAEWEASLQLPEGA